MSTTVFPSGGRAVVDAMCAKYPELFVNEDEKQRVLTTRIGEQFAYTFGAQWGNKKRAGLSDAFRSKDSLACLEADGTISIWDLFQGSSPVVVLVHDGAAPDFPNDSPGNTTFMPCNPVDHLGGGAQPPDPPDPPAEDLEPRVAVLEATVAELDKENDELRAELLAQSNRIAALEAHALKDTDTLKVIGPTTTAGPSFLKHWHDVNLTVQRG